MTIINICVLDGNYKLFCGQGSGEDAHRFIAGLKNNPVTLDGLIEGINSNKYPWNLNDYRWNENKKKVTLFKKNATKEDFYFEEKAGLPALFITENDVLRETPEGNFFFDLMNKKVFHLNHHSPISLEYDNKLRIYKSYSDPYARKKVKECEEENERLGTNRDCIEEFKVVKKSLPKGYEYREIDLDHIPEGKRYNETNYDAVRKLIGTIQECNHPSGEFYRSLSDCL